MRAYLGITGAIFGVIAVLHVLRLLLDWPAQIGTWTVPLTECEALNNADREA